MHRFAWNNLKSRPLRSSLSILGLTVAIAGMVGLFSVASGVKNLLDKTFGKIPGLVALQPGAPIPLFSRFPKEWSREIAKTRGVRTARNEVWARAHMVNGKMAFNPPRFLFGADVAATEQLKVAVYRDDLLKGRFLNATDRQSNHCVISQAIAEELNMTVGDSFKVDGRSVEIVGIYHCGSILLDVAIVMDEDTVRNMARFGEDQVSAVYIEPDGSVADDELAESLRKTFCGRGLAPLDLVSRLSPFSEQILNRSPQASSSPWQDVVWALARAVSSSWPKIRWNLFRPNTPPLVASSGTDDSSNKPEPDVNVHPGEESLEIRSASQWGQRIQAFTGDLDLVLLLMTTIGVAIALLSIVNTMMMSVSERIVEFGVLRANGWSRSHILQLIGWESLIVGFIGGVLGAILGWSGAEAVNWYWPTKIHLYPGWPVLLFSIGFSMCLGVIGGLYPAFVAARMSPMIAIRR